MISDPRELVGFSFVRRASGISGYQLSADRKHVEPNPAEQAVLSRIRKLRAKGYTLRAIAEKLNRASCKTRRGSEWRHVYVAGVLRTAA
jgi:hypothetical protein